MGDRRGGHNYDLYLESLLRGYIHIVQIYTLAAGRVYNIHIRINLHVLTMIMII